ncbi:MAG: PEP-CTERM sorting domain-containing protein [Phycisphaeraceae bacterium]|nr:PEP-CTERM sorting domain-containing protein [Phycisphaeraceae bacterium]
MDRKDLARQRASIAVLLVMSMLIGIGPVSADTYTPTRSWDNGGADGDWSTAGAWNPVGTPIATDNLAINNGATVTFNSVGVSVARLYLASDEFLEGHMIVTGGDLTITSIFRPGDENLGTFTQTGGAVIAGNAFRMGERGPEFENSNGHGTYNMQGGTLTLNGSASNTRIGSAGATGIFNHTDGTVTHANASGGMQISTAVSGAIGHGTYSITGPTSVLSVLGTVFVDATANDGQGDGHFNVTGLGPTISFGAYTQNDGGNLSFTTDANGVAVIQVAGDVSLNGNLAIDLNALTANPSVILLIDNQSANAINGAFTNAAEGAVFGDYQLTYLYDNGGGNNNDLALVLIPEPASVVLLGVATVLVTVRQRRRCRG